MYAPNGSLKVNNAPPAVGRPAITEVARGFMTAFPDMVVTMDGVLVQDDRAAYRWTLAGTNTGPGGTGQKVRISGFEEWKFDKDGLIAASLGHFDEADYAHQLQHGCGPVPPKVECKQQHPELYVPDVLAAVHFYTKKLGFWQSFLWADPPDSTPTMAGVNLGNVQMFLQQGTPHPQGCALYFVVGNADELFAFQQANGVEVLVPPGDRLYGLRDYRVRDLNGYNLSFGHHLFNTGPPVEIERVDVPVRLEKRLAALLQDLAEHKRMSLSSCLEEILLHTNEPLGDGVASPHTKRTIVYIQELKRKHGIDYDSHASYRFEERRP
jgi:catechol 2,3-dioxygenase-like lactoylglutathione lyase family enzyme